MTAFDFGPISISGELGQQSFDKSLSVDCVTAKHNFIFDTSLMKSVNCVLRIRDLRMMMLFNISKYTQNIMQYSI